MKHSTYSSYKSGDVFWPEELPAHWSKRRVGYCTTKVGSGKTPSGGAANYLSSGVMLIRSQNVHDDGMRLDDVVYIDDDTHNEMNNSQVHVDDVLLNITGASLGRCTIFKADEEANVNQHVCIIRTNSDIYPEFMQSVLTSSMVKAQIFSLETGSSREGLNFQQIRSLVISIPPLDEQKSIATFLKSETLRIDSLISKKRELVDLLQEKRQALISRCVTRGLPPEAAKAAGLDPNPRLKPSGVEWLGDVPEDWTINKFSREVKIAEGQVNPESEPYSSMTLVGPNHIESGTGRLLKKETAAEQNAESGKYLCHAGNVLYSKIRPALAKVALSDEDCLCSADMYPLDGRQELSNRFLFWFLLSEYFVAWSVLESERVAMPKINRDTLNELRLLVPPPAQQQAIANYLESETARIDDLVSRVEAAIDCLEEYRKALIAAAVTGKIDVREVVK